MTLAGRQIGTRELTPTVATAHNAITSFLMMPTRDKKPVRGLDGLLLKLRSSRVKASVLAR